MTRSLGIDLGTTSSAVATEALRPVPTRILGIDLGTTSSAIATASDTKAARTVPITQVAALAKVEL